ncbi:hypothetical protein TC41_1321 [Alicyclobacillus acidocaldarius subsp. acidocaldarius Tc-4-1]|uniref:Uncharacterized protein n=1 Tax=Alicyclobacillus acidocaldarius (strain Tc-4-1) TaxID=1048834 RepID=F8IHW9_ALIAT|nr:hypothetical protein TC41_1321 [Alicyclobacillus acidocaldarius subsp. acidocaldarius Tc-4-1]
MNRAQRSVSGCTTIKSKEKKDDLGIEAIRLGRYGTSMALQRMN